MPCSLSVVGQLETLRTELVSEQQARRDAEATSASLSHDRQRLQRARDELASSLLVDCLAFSLSPRVTVSQFLAAEAPLCWQTVWAAALLQEATPMS